MKRLPLFWKIYLSVLAILLFSALAIHSFDRWSESGAMHRAEAEFETRSAKLGNVMRELAKELEERVDLSESDDDREVVLSWVEQRAKEKGLDSGLDLYVTLTGTQSPERFSIRVQDSGVRIAPPLAAMAKSPSGRIILYGAQEPYTDWDELKTPLPVGLFIFMVVFGAGICFLVVHHLMVPLRELEGATSRIAQGDFSARVGDIPSKGGDELQKLGASFNTMAEHMERLLESQKRLLVDISHELRSPLQRLHIALALIEKRGEGHVDGASLEQAHQDIRTLDAMVEELFVLTRSESGVEVNKEVVRLKELLASLIHTENFEWAEEDRNITLQGEEADVYGNARLLARAIRNLIHNALRYSPERSQVDVSLARESKEAVLRVRDHGPGVPEEDLENIFLPFYRTDAARERVSGGTGLGLSIVRRVAEEHQGSCVAANAADGGLVMTLCLPLYEVPENRMSV